MSAGPDETKSHDVVLEMYEQSNPSCSMTESWQIDIDFNGRQVNYQKSASEAIVGPGSI
jgi:hypothetical protein